MKISLRFGCMVCGHEVIATGEAYSDVIRALKANNWKLEDYKLGTAYCPACHGLNSNEDNPNITQRKDLGNGINTTPNKSTS